MSDLAYWVQELREAMAAQWAKPLPCSGLQAFQRACRVTIARDAVLHQLSKVAA